MSRRARNPLLGERETWPRVSYRCNQSLNSQRVFSSDLDCGKGKLSPHSCVCLTSASHTERGNEKHWENYLIESNQSWEKAEMSSGGAKPSCKHHQHLSRGLENLAHNPRSGTRAGNTKEPTQQQQPWSRTDPQPHIGAAEGNESSQRCGGS